MVKVDLRMKVGGDMATIKCSTLAELEQVIMKQVAEAMSQDKLGKDIKEEVQKHIRDDVMYVYHPQSYQTTGEFHDSVVSSQPDVNGNSVEISTYNDPNLMNMAEPWYHQSVIDGRDIRENLAEIIEEGKTYDLWNHGDAAYLKPRPFMENTYRDLSNSKKHVKKLVQHLKELGLDAKEI
jgi:hypothetical protein